MLIPNGYLDKPIQNATTSKDFLHSKWSSPVATHRLTNTYYKMCWAMRQGTNVLIHSFYFFSPASSRTLNACPKNGKFKCTKGGLDWELRRKERTAAEFRKNKPLQKISWIFLSFVHKLFLMQNFEMLLSMFRICIFPLPTIF